MLNKKYGFFAGMGSILILGALVAAAWAAPADKAGANEAKTAKVDSPGPDQEGEGHMGQRLMSELNLTDDQIAKLKGDRLAARKQMIRDMAESKTLHLDLFDETMNDKPDLEKVERLAKQIGELQTKMIINRTKGMLFLRSLLTPEQKRKFNEMHTRQGLDDGPWHEAGEGPERHMGHHEGGRDK